MEKDFIDILTRHGWSDHAAQAALELGGSYPWGVNADAPWRNQRMRDWCSAALYKPPTDQSAQLAYLAYDMRNNMGSVWEKVQASKTTDEAKDALGGYFNNLKGGN